VVRTDLDQFHRKPDMLSTALLALAGLASLAAASIADICNVSFQ
jgi:hypothetical protein